MTVLTALVMLVIGCDACRAADLHGQEPGEPAAVREEIRVKLRANPQKPDEPDEDPTVALTFRGETRTGSLIWAKEEIQELALDEWITENIPVLLVVQRAVRYEHVMKMVALARGEGFREVNFGAPEQPAEEPDGQQPEEPAEQRAEEPHGEQAEEPTGQRAEEIRRIAAREGRVEIDIYADGATGVGGERMTMAELRYLLKAKRTGTDSGKPTEEAILVRADRRATWGDIQNVMELASRLRYYKMSFSRAFEDETE